MTPHGFGHAARLSAVLSCLQQDHPRVTAEIFTTVPRWFFDDSLSSGFRYHPVDCDVGLVQRDALSEDLTATLERLRTAPWRDDRLIEDLATTVRRRGCEAVLVDVAALGIVVGKRCGLPVALLENFTWDWIYRAYEGEIPEIVPHTRDLAEIYSTVDLRIQSEPACAPRSSAHSCPPVARRSRESREGVRARLGVEQKERLVLVTMGGIPWRYSDQRRIRAPRGTVLALPGAAESTQRRGQLILLPHRSGFYHPDLVAASDGVLGKLGYSTVAECWQAGTPMAFVPRPSFPESTVLARFAGDALGGMTVAPQAFRNDGWMEILPELALRPRLPIPETSGAAAAAELLGRWLELNGSSG